MSEVFYLRPIDPPVRPDDVRTLPKQALNCFDLHRVDWKHSFLSADGGRMLCWYRAPDAESARLALRELGSDMNAVWAGKALGEEPGWPALSAAGVAAEIPLDAPPADGASLRAALRRRGVELVRAFVSARGTLMVALFDAADEGAVRDALVDAALPPSAVWRCTPIAPPPG